MVMPQDSSELPVNIRVTVIPANHPYLPTVRDKTSKHHPQIFITHLIQKVPINPTRLVIYSFRGY